MEARELNRDARAWMHANLTTQGYCLTDAQRRELALGLRFSTGLCLTLVVVALALTSEGMLFALAAIGVIAGFTSRHAFKLATVWLLTTAVLLAAGATTAGLALGVLLLTACATVTATNFCLPSKAMALWERHHQPGRLV